MRGFVTAAALGILVCAGCGKSSVSGTPPTAPGATTTTTADLTKPILTYTWQSSQDKEPLTFAKMIARAAGGTWVAIAPHPLEEIKWTPSSPRGYQPITVSELLDAV